VHSFGCVMAFLCWTIVTTSFPDARAVAGGIKPADLDAAASNGLPFALGSLHMGRPAEDAVGGHGAAFAIARESDETAESLGSIVAAFIFWAAIPFAAVAVFFKRLYRGNSSNPDDDSMGTAI
jgi:hypothetical protein